MTTCGSLSIINIVPFYRALAEDEQFAKDEQFALALAFSMDEVNRNPDLLPNESLWFQLPSCVSDLYTLFPLPEKDVFPNYVCEKEFRCTVALTGPNWEASVMLHRLTIRYSSQKVRLCGNS